MHMGKIILTFNSLYGIQLVKIAIYRSCTCYFQFPLWDSLNYRIQEISLRRENFQFPLWDSGGGGPEARAGPEAFNSLYGIRAPPDLLKFFTPVTLSIPFMGFYLKLLNA